MLKWYALRVRSGCERSVLGSLTRKGYEAFVPSHSARRVWSDRLKSVELPLFEGYVFCRLEISKRLPILMTPHVLQFVTVGNSPVEIDDAKVAALQAAMRAQVAVEPWPLERDGRPAKLESGPLAGLEGRLVGQEGASRMVVTLPVLCKSVALKIESDWLAPMEANRNAGVAAVHDTD